MKKLTKNLVPLLFMTLCLAGLFQVSPVLAFTFVFALSFIPQPKGVAMMAIQREIWTKDIVDNLFKDNAFAQRAFNEDEYVLEGKVVHIPVAGQPSTVNKNVTAFPVQAVKRTDADITYALDTYYTVPRHIERIERYELSYDKRQSVLGEDQAAITDAAIDGMLFRWAPGSANVIPTTGAATAATASGATGNRKAFGKDVFGKIKLSWDKAKIKGGSRIALLTADHHQQLLDSFSDVEKTNFNNLADAKRGVVGMYLGVEIMMRSTVQRYRKVAGVWTAIDEQDPAFGSSDQTGDSATSLFYHDMSVSRALGAVEMFDKENDPTYYGDIYSFILRMGGRIRRAAGVYAVVEDITP